MKNLISIISIALLAVACGATADKACDLQIPAPEDVVMYQVNPRNFAPQNSFNAVAAHLDSIKTMGVNTIWFMPIYEIGKIKSVNSAYNNGVNKLKPEGPSITTSARQVMALGVKLSKGKELKEPEEILEIGDEM